ncbi:hypothetical protein EDB85DRAFT_2177150 [Lactarius pseudohatsudake]|nr:hypothetical protein EDB85DRAFT_2177150 [Lactarius pseudohatsudake]
MLRARCAPQIKWKATRTTSLLRNASERVAKLPGGQYYPEQDWINMHSVQLPSNASSPEWKMDRTIVTIADLPLNPLVSTLRDRIIATTGSSLSAGKPILSYNGKVLTNRNTIASYNLEEDDLLVLRFGYGCVAISLCLHYASLFCSLVSEIIIICYHRWLFPTSFPTEAQTPQRTIISAERKRAGVWRSALLPKSTRGNAV